ncbi:MAG: hypothetical protein GXO70_11365 [Acidobacteria bacterium]|nr:hypothetical protein [Acidobacteriota bacterium]
MANVRSSLVLVFLLCILCFNTNANDIKQKQSVVYGKQDLINYIEKWKIKDGLAGTFISDYFCDFLNYNPVLFFQTMKNNPPIYDEWVDRIGELSFVDWGGCIDRECLRNMVISSLEQCCLINNPDLKPLRKKLLDKLRKTKVRKID